MKNYRSFRSNSMGFDKAKKIFMLLPVLIMLLAQGGCISGPTLPPTPVESPVKYEETIFRTGVAWLAGKPSYTHFVVSPDMAKILFRKAIPNAEIARLGGLYVFDVKTRQTRQIPETPGYSWYPYSWSRDGSQIAIISYPLHEDPLRPDVYQYVDEAEILLLDSQTWEARKLAVAPAASDIPFFSQDGKKIYYFKGKKRRQGKTPASQFDIYVYDLSSNEESRLTNERAYMMGSGYDDGDEILFSAAVLKGQRLFSPDPTSINKMESKKNNPMPQTAIHALNKRSLEFHLLNIDQRILTPIDGVDDEEFFFGLSLQGKDARKNIYFTASRSLHRYYRRFLYRCNAQGNNCSLLREIRNDGEKVRIDFNTGTLFRADVLDGEIVFRRLVELPSMQ